MQDIEIGRRGIGPGKPCFIIAEAGVNHNGILQQAIRLIEVAVEARADAVKFQTFKADRLISPATRKARYQAINTDAAESQLDMVRSLELPYAWHKQLMDCCRECGILFLSTPFDDDSADFLAALGVAAFKISSGEVTNLPFLERIARFGKPVILSTGMARLGEVETALDAIYRQGLHQVIVLQCVSSYPTSARDANLRAMETMRVAFDVPVGYSDHTMGNEVSLAAVALGACVIEKHFTLDRSLPGPDQQASAEPDELKALVTSIRNVEAALGHGRKEPAECERDTAEVARKSLLAAIDIKQGDKITRDAIAIMRPGTGLPPGMLPHVLGRVARRAIAAGELLDLGAFE
jgi:N,N'-diacetyllegionaminate synthase